MSEVIQPNEGGHDMLKMILGEKIIIIKNIDEII